MLTCKHCSYQTPYKQILTRHMKKKHPEIPIEKPIYECSYCHKSFASSITCKKHEQNKVCQKENPSSSSLATQEAIQEVIESIYTQIEAKSPIPDIIQLPLPPYPLQIPEILPDLEWEEQPIKQTPPTPFEKRILKINRPSLFQQLFRLPILKFVPIVACTVLFTKWMRFKE